MCHRYRTCAAILLGLVVSAAAHADNPPGWHLLWGDEFDGEAIDAARWNVMDAGLVKNNELQYYSPDDAFLRDGSLVLRAQRRLLGGRDYTSGHIDSKGHFALAFGRVEFRAKMAKGQGLWPAVWMLPTDSTWPPEIDILETVGSQPNAVTMTLHYGDVDSHQWDTESHIDDTADYTAEFHDYALEWDPDQIRWYVDGVQRYQVMDNIPQKSFYLILNLAVGGDMPGDPDETTPFPAEMAVDYIRVYGKEEPDTFFLTTAAVEGRLDVAPWKARYNKSDQVRLRVTPSIGYMFTGWSGDASGSEPDLLLTMDQHRDVVARFAPDPDAPVLLSRGAPTKASSIEDDNEDLGPASLTDGSRGTRWSSKFSDGQWARIDLGMPHRIEAIRLDWENAYGKAYDIQVSDDAQKWTTVFSQFKGVGGVEEIRLDASGRYVRLLGHERATGWGWSLFEIEIFGKAR